MADVRFEVATRAHAEALAPRMRAADAAECEASGGYTPLEALLASLEASELAHALLLDGEVAALFGVAAAQPPTTALGHPGVGCAWSLTSDAVDAHPRDFLRASRNVVRELLRRYLVLYNFVDARYAGALRWARWLGFHVAPAAPFGPQGLPFHLITLRRAHAHV